MTHPDSPMIIGYLQKLYDSTSRQVIHYFQRKLLKQIRKDSFNSLKTPCVFVLSTGRVGSKTLSALIGPAANVFAYHEPEPNLYGLSKLAYHKYKED